VLTFASSQSLLKKPMDNLNITLTTVIDIDHLLFTIK